MSLTRDEILKQNDIKVKKIRVPVWEKDVWIRQLTRGEQDEYLKRQYHLANINPGKGVSAMNIYGHDAFLCVCAVSDQAGERLFKNTPEEIEKLNEKNGEAVGFLATEIVIWSGMKDDVEAIEEVKN